MKKSSEQLSPKDFTSRLRIDRSDLEGCLEDQSMLYYEVAELRVQAVAVQDALKLDIEELHAKLDQKIRHDASVAQEKTTEKGIENEITSDKGMQALQREFLTAKAEAAEWGPIVEAVGQRGYAIRDLVAIELRRMSIDETSRTMEKTATEYRAKRGEKIAEEAGQMRRRKRIEQ